MTGLGNSTSKESWSDTTKDDIVLKDKKKKKIKEDYVKELEKGLTKLDSHSYESIDKLMQSISKKHGITGKILHDEFKDKHGKIPDTWIKEKK